MRLTFKLVLLFLVSGGGGGGVNAFFGARSEVARYEREIAEHHTVMGRVLRDAFAARVRSDGEAKAVSMLDYMDKQSAGRHPVDCPRRSCRGQHECAAGAAHGAGAASSDE
jgi:hypothetical protein